MIEVMCFGEPLIGLFAKDNQEKLPALIMDAGGDVVNVALAVSNLGHTVKFVTKLSNDIFGKKFKDTFQKAKVDTSNSFLDNNNSGICFVLFDSYGKHQFLYSRKNSASANFTLEDAKKVSLDQIKIFHLSGISQAISKSCSYDLNYRNALWSEDYFNSIAWHTIKHFADIVTLNHDEARILKIHGDPLETVKTIRREGPKIVALKLGEDGCIISSYEGIVSCDSFKINGIVETTGAGDAFNGALIVSFLENMNLKETARFSNAVASTVCRKIGCTVSQFAREEVKNIITDTAA